MNTPPKRPTAAELGPMRPMEAFQQDAATELHVVADRQSQSNENHDWGVAK
jgi:hypothetical protein